ncbi:MAG: bifunctional 4-hydroxy-2-oxoglutarate aldolase/2-dehydro-3-deoxy-phosphogluconate aldolase [Aeromonas veronii]
MKFIVERLARLKIIPVITIEQSEDIIPLGAILAENGLPVAEITLRSTDAVDAIRLLRSSNPEMLIGAGTVLTSEQVKAAKDAGADFIVSPGLNPNVVKTCQKLKIPIIPGVNNPTDIESALELGLTTLKFFPAEPSGGVPMIKALLAPYSKINLMPTGGISSNNILNYLAIPNVIACGGSWMVEKSLVSAKNWTEISRLTRNAVIQLQ